MVSVMDVDMAAAVLVVSHERADALVATYSYRKPDQSQLARKKANIRLAMGELIKGAVQVIKKNGGEKISDCGSATCGQPA